MTYGHADVNGDGVSDLVLVDTFGRVQVRLGGGGLLSARVLRDSSLRLQALPDMFASGRHDIVVASSTAGCCDSYQMLGSSAVVLQDWHGKLRLLHFSSGRTLTLSFNTGRGDVYTGIRCRANHLTTTSILELDVNRLRVSTREYGINTTIATLQGVTHRVMTGDGEQALKLTRTSCPGTNAFGWAD